MSTVILETPRRKPAVRPVRLGYIIDRQFWRMGFATEAARVITDWAFDHVGLETVCALIRPENEPSRAVARKLGMTEGPMVSYFTFPHIAYALTDPRATRRS